MVKFLKFCGKGILYVLAFPFMVLIICLYAVIGLLIFLFLCGKSIILFFKGRTIFSDLPEDIEAKKILEQQNQPIVNEQKENINDNGPLSLYPSDSNMYKSDFNGLNEAPKPVEQPIEIKQEPIANNSVEIQYDESLNRVEPEENKEETFGTYKPLSSNDIEKDK